MRGCARATRAVAFPPMAACITSAARLMLAILETVVTAWRWHVGLLLTPTRWRVVATDHGGLVPCPGGPERDSENHACVRALSWTQMDEIVQRFESLNPYNRDLVPGSVLEIEAENYASDRGAAAAPIATRSSAKRYALYNLDEDGPTHHPNRGRRRRERRTRGRCARRCALATAQALRARARASTQPNGPESQSRDWIGQLWQHILRTDVHNQARSPELDPRWLDRPALTRTTITSPRLLSLSSIRAASDAPLSALASIPLAIASGRTTLGSLRMSTSRRFNDSRSASCLSRRSSPTRAGGAGCLGRMPTSSAAGTRSSMHDGSGEQLASASEGRVIVKTYRSVLADYRTHPEAKSLGPDGSPCDRATLGLLSRRPIKAAAIHYIGKESNKIEEALSGLITDLGDALTEYQDPEQDPFQRLVVPVLRASTVDETAAGAQVSARTVKRARAGRAVGKHARERLTHHAITHARAQLRDAPSRPPTDPEALLAAYLDQPSAPVHVPPLCACGCGQPVNRRGSRGPAAEVALRRMPQARGPE